MRTRGTASLDKKKKKKKKKKKRKEKKRKEKKKKIRDRWPPFFLQQGAHCALFSSEGPLCPYFFLLFPLMMWASPTSFSFYYYYYYLNDHLAIAFLIGRMAF
jgi:hypothetical protein